jgi:hypothetical protein
MFNLTDSQKEKAKQNALKAKEIFIYQLSLRLAIDPDSIDFDSNINLPEESSENYSSYVVLYNAIEDLKKIRG